MFQNFIIKSNFLKQCIRMNHKLLVNYENKVLSNILKDDQYQRKLISAFINLDKSLKTVDKNLFSKIFFKDSHICNKGLYIYGSVGCGKTMLMDMFFNSCDEKLKKRIHFHEFMMQAHKEMHEVKKKMPPRTVQSGPQSFDPIPIVAKIMCQDYRLLCFDEFQVTDIADAMILSRLFEHIFSIGVFIVATSNRQPDDLYKRGLQRVNFLPFIELVKRQCEVICLDSVVDYRRLTLPRDQLLYISPINSKCPAEDLLIFFQQLTHNSEIISKTLTVFGRHVILRRTCGAILITSFPELCEQPLSAADYIEISNNFHTVFLDAIPFLSLQRKGRLRRFITLIDALYDKRIRLVCSTVAEPDKIFISELGNDEDNRNQRMLMDDLGLKENDSSIFTGEEELFDHQRTISRLMEMRTKEYWDSCDHILLNKTP